jgi:hypothetical protein
MTEQEDPRITEIMLDFFGRVTASATHEIKNGLAVMNEQSRLAGELLELSRQGRDLDPDRLEVLIGRVVDRIGQTDLVVRRLNRFAHSADLGRDSCQAGEIMVLMAQMHQRLASTKGISLTWTEDGPASAPVAKACLVQLALWACLEGMIAASVEGGQVGLSLKREQDRVTFSFRAELREEPQKPPAWLLEDLTGRAEIVGLEGLDLSVPVAGQGA